MKKALTNIAMASVLATGCTTSHLNKGSFEKVQGRTINAIKKVDTQNVESYTFNTSKAINFQEALTIAPIYESAPKQSFAFYQITGENIKSGKLNFTTPLTIYNQSAGTFLAIYARPLKPRDFW